MDMVKINGQNFSKASYLRARMLTDKKFENGNVTASSVRTSVTQMFERAGFTVSAHSGPGDTGMNIGIAPSLFEEMASNPERMVELKTKLLDAKKFFPQLGSQLGAFGQVVGFGINFGANGKITSWGHTRNYSTGQETNISSRIPADRLRDLTEIMLEKIEEQQRLERSRESWQLSQEQSEQVDYLSQDDYKTALDSMANRNFSNDNEERIISRRYFKNEDGELMKKIRTDRGVRVINLDDPFAM